MNTYTKPKPGTTELFGPDIDLDPWMAFHGTSSIFMDSIEKFGFDSKRILFSKTEISRVVDIFDELKWLGVHQGGLSVLKNYSLNHDRANSEKPPVYFAETSHRSGLYASADFAGGECARALRYSFQDLRAFSTGAVGEGLKSDRHKVAKEILELSELEESANRFLAGHEHGVIYAVRFNSEDLDFLELSSAMGIKSYQVINPNRIVAKLIIPLEWQHRHQPDPRRLNRFLETGLINELWKSRSPIDQQE